MTKERLQEIVTNCYSKNISSYNHWMREIGFPRYDSLMYGLSKGGRAYCTFDSENTVANIEFIDFEFEGQKCFIPLFEFTEKYKDLNKMQTQFWIRHHYENQITEWDNDLER